MLNFHCLRLLLYIRFKDLYHVYVFDVAYNMRLIDLLAFHSCIYHNI